MRKVFRKLAKLEEVLKILSKYEFTGFEEVAIEGALGRVLAEDVYSEVDVPSFDRAALDGYAVRAEDTFGADEDRPSSLKVIGKAAAGHPFLGEVGPNEAVEVATGAPLPRGANAVVMEEYTSREGDELLVYRAVAPGDNVHGAGSDIRRGELVLPSGTMLTPRDIGALAAVGIKRVKVRRKPRIVIFSTGDELVSPGERLNFGRIYDVNQYTLANSVVEDGGEPVLGGILPDDESSMRESIRRGLDIGDLVLISGSTSVGAGDVIYRILDELGPPGVLVHGIAIHPGKPTIIAESNGKLIVGLPGYPTSSLTAYRTLISPLIRRWSGLPPVEESLTVEAMVAERIFGEKGRKDLLPVHVIKDEDYLVFPVPTGSEAITTLTRADGYIVMDEDQEILEEGERVTVYLYGKEVVPDIAVMGSHCLGLEFLLKELRNMGLKIKSVYVGSTGGFKAIRHREADIAGVHALDPETGEYNVSLMDKFSLKGKAILVRGYVREQGIIVARGNPKGIKSVADFFREDVLIINRNKGSGTRIMIDLLLKREAESRGIEFSPDKVRGYWTEAKSHNAVAAAIANGVADAGIGIRAVAELYGLDFIPLFKENYDFIIRKTSLDKDGVRDFLSLLKDDRVKEELSKIAGIEVPKEMGEVIYE